MTVASKLKKLPMPKPITKPLWAGPCASGPFGGVTQSMLGRYLCCPERFRIAYVLGLQPVPKFEAAQEFGNMWHACEEGLATGVTGAVEHRLRLCVNKLAVKYPFHREDIEAWSAKCRAAFPIYAEYWKNHPDVKARTPLMQEQVFDVPYRLPSDRVVRLRGKFDSVDLIGAGKDAGIYLQENKTKSSIDEEKIRRQLRFDLQTMIYFTSLGEFQRSLIEDSRPQSEWNKTFPNWCKVRGEVFDKPVVGIRYNVIRRSAHKSVESMLEKIEADRKAGRVGEWFARWKVEIGEADVAAFKRTCLDPVLENLCDDYDWWADCLENGKDPFDHDWFIERAKYFHHPRHFRFPYGIYNPIAEGGFGDVDGFLETGLTVGLRRAETLFEELN